ncbi:hypothetical protein [Ureibacillus chungkukjangi]|uniref:Uncharacterized protein n=1 Tax=Ureibacillus chungkukjangi TaxID=1202712 RepID=A0A318TJF0_9BACL|nr:hypothetical protein [Ureibacillus chungkukjangi]PYF03977.1 hypothetical protein BJ095_1265 [Ureibacillus chungkukjangi]
MRVSGFSLNIGNFEERKRAIQRKEANDAYKKNAIYTQDKKNPMLKILEDLLSGKTEKELFKNDNVLLNEGNESIAPIDMKEDIEATEFQAEAEIPTDMMLQAETEVASDEENINRLSSIDIDQFLSPERLTNTTGPADPFYPLNKSFETLILDKMYTKAISSYTNQMLMAQNGFQLDQPKFSHIA